MKDIVRRIDDLFETEEFGNISRFDWDVVRAIITNLEEDCSELEEMNNCLDTHVKQLQKENEDLRSQLIKRWLVCTRSTDNLAALTVKGQKLQ